MSGTHVVRPRGEIDVATVDTLVATWFAEIDQRSPELVVVDLTEVTFMDSTGLRALVQVRKRVALVGGEVVVRGASRQSRRLLQLTGLDQIFTQAYLPASAHRADVVDRTH